MILYCGKFGYNIISTYIEFWSSCLQCDEDCIGFKDVWISVKHEMNNYIEDTLNDITFYPSYKHFNHDFITKNHDQNVKIVVQQY